MVCCVALVNVVGVNPLKHLKHFSILTNWTHACVTCQVWFSLNLFKEIVLNANIVNLDQISHSNTSVIDNETRQKDAKINRRELTFHRQNANPLWDVRYK